MQKIEKIGYRGTQPFNLLSIDCVDPGDDFFRSIAAGAMVKKSAKGSLIVGVLVDVGDSEFGLPQECMIRTFRSEEHTSELQSLMRTSYAVVCLKKQKPKLHMIDYLNDVLTPLCTLIH